MPKFTRRKLLAAVPPVVVAASGARAALGGDGMHEATHLHHSPTAGHAAMVGESVPAPGGPRDLDALLYPPPALPHQPGRVRDYTLSAID